MNKFIKKNHMSKLLVSSLTCILLASCGGDVDETPRSQRPVSTPTPSPTPVVTPTPAPIEPATVTVDLTAQQILGQSAVMERNKFLNFHDSLDGGRVPLSVIEQYTMDFNLGGGRQFWSPLGQPRLIDSLENSGQYLTTEDAKSIGAGRLAADLNNPRLALFDRNRLVVTDHVESAMSGGLNNDPLEGSRWAADYFTYYFNDDTRPLFYEPMNEPFIKAGKYVDIYGDSQSVLERMTLWHKEIGKEFRSRPELADVKILGFSSAFPSFENRGFAHWRSRMEMFMEDAGEYVDAFSIHLYDGVNVVGQDNRRSGSNSQAILDLVETYSMLTFGEVKPHAITEYGNIVETKIDAEYDPLANTQTVKTFNHIMLELMAREDRILTSIPFITGYSEFHWQSTEAGNGNPYNPALWRPQKEKIKLEGDKWVLIDPNDPKNYVINDNAMFLEFWKDVKGRRAHVTNPDPDVQVAAFVDADKAYIIISNLETENKKVTLNLSAIAGSNFTSVETEHLSVPPFGSEGAPTHTVADLSKTGAVDGKSFDEVTLAASDTIKYTIVLDKNIETKTTAQRKTYYASEHILGIAANKDLSFSFNDIDLSNLDETRSTATLRMSIARPHSRSKQPVLTVNGNVVSVPGDWPGYDQANRDLFFGAISIPVPYGMLTPNTEVVATFPDSTGNVSSMVLDVNNIVDPDKVSVPVESITLGDGGESLIIDELRRIKPAILPKDATDKSLTWFSSNKDVATVDKNGFVMALAEGTTEVKATSVSQTDISGTVTVTVTMPTPMPTATPVPTPTPAPTPTPPPNFLRDANTDFEKPRDEALFRVRTAALDPGQASAGGTVKISAEAARDGDGGLEIDNSGGSLKMLFTDLALASDFDPAKSYVMKIDVKAVSGDHRWFTFSSGGNWEEVKIAVESDWKTVSRIFPPNVIPTNFGIAFHMDPGGTGGVIYVDNIRLEEVVP